MRRRGTIVTSGDGTRTASTTAALLKRRDERRARVRGVAVAIVVALAACRRPVADEVEMQVRNVGFDRGAGSPVVILQSSSEQRLLPIWVGPAEAQSIALEIQRVTPPRPLTHDLMKRILDGTGVALRRVRITALESQTFFATIVLEQSGREIEVDSRPSDAIALALRAACPIFVNRALLGSDAAITLRDESAPGVAKLWGITVQDLDPSVAESLGSAGVTGVLVSDAGTAAAADGLRRGDVIVGVDDAPVSDVAALQAVAGSRHERSRRLEVRRAGTRVVVHLTTGAVEK
jgi:bifunctional DNase/RNase